MHPPCENEFKIGSSQIMEIWLRRGCIRNFNWIVGLGTPFRHWNANHPIHVCVPFWPWKYSTVVAHLIFWQSFVETRFCSLRFFTKNIAAPTPSQKIAVPAKSAKKRSVAQIKVQVMAINSVQESSKSELSLGLLGTSKFTTKMSENAVSKRQVVKVAKR